MSLCYFTSATRVYKGLVAAFTNVTANVNLRFDIPECIDIDREVSVNAKGITVLKHCADS